MNVPVVGAVRRCVADRAIVLLQSGVASSAANANLRLAAPWYCQSLSFPLLIQRL